MIAESDRGTTIARTTMLATFSTNLFRRHQGGGFITGRGWRDLDAVRRLERARNRIPRADSRFED